MRDDDNQYVHDGDDRANSRRLRGNEIEEARQRLAASAGYVDPVETPRAPSTPRLQRNTPLGRNANSVNRIASIKRGGKARSASPMTGPNTFTPNTFTATPSSFSFGAQQAQQQPNPGFGASEGFAFGQQQPSEGNGMDRIEQNSTPAPAASFTFGQSQPQQPVSNGFGQQNNNPFGGFGQQNAAPTGGAQTTPSFSFGAQTQSSNTGNAPSNTFGGFGQQTQASSAAPTSFAFGAQSQSSSPAPTQNPFSGFNSQPQQNGTAAQSNSFTFGAQPANSRPSANGSTTPSFGGFGATQPAQPSSQQPATGLANGSATPSFGGFGATQPAQTSAQPAASSLSSLFAPQPSTEQKSPSPFQGSTSLFSKPAETPKADPGANGSSTPSFGAFGATQPAPQQTTSSLFAPKPSTEQKSPSLFQGSTSLFSKPAETPKADGWSSFKTASPAPTAGGEAAGTSVLSGWQKEQTSKTSFSFSQDQMPTGDVDDDDAMASPEKSTPAQPASSALGGGSNLFGASQPAVTAGNDPFSRISKPTDMNGTNAKQSADSAATPKAPTSSGGELFSRMSFPDKAQDHTVSATPAPKASNPFSGFSVAPPATAPAKSLFAGTGNSFAIPPTPTTAAEKAPDAPATFKSAQTPSTNQTAKSASTTYSKKFDAANASAMRQLNEGLLQRLAHADPNVDYTKVLEYYIRKAKAINTVKGKNPNFHGAAVKHSIEIDHATAPTEKRRKSKETVKETVEYPKLPAGASNTAKFFEAALDKPAESGVAARSLFAPQSAITTTESKDVEQTPKASTFGAFKPSTSSLFSPAKTAAQTPKAPTFGAFQPSTSSLFSPATTAAPTPKPSTFGAVQPAASLFTPAKTATSNSQSNGHGHTGSSSLFAPKPAADAGKPKPAATGGFMPTFAAPPAGGSNFLSAFGQNASKEQDQARKKAMAEDFDSEDDDPEEWKKQYEEKQAAKRKAIEDAAKSGGGFSIKPATTVAATNGAGLFSTNGTTESSTTKPAEVEGEEDAANDTQVEDMTALQPAEQAESDILYHIEKAKSYKFEQKANADKPEWIYKALGPIWLLRNKSTGKTRLLQKVAPLGKAGMNFNVLKAANMYAQQSKKVTANFIDHINEKEPKKPSRWFVQCGKEEDAKELARLLVEEAGKQ
jgi:hypothetical protein